MPNGFFGNAVILGIGVAVESNVPEALKAALEVFPDSSDHGATLPTPTIYIVIAADHGTCTWAREHCVRGKQLHIADDGIRLLADAERGRANCSFRADVIGSELFREAVNTAALFLATQQGRTPVHASAVMFGDRALVLAGRSGSGKSTLALAGNRAGLPVLAEDAVFVQLAPTFRVWGLAGHIHVLEEDAPPGSEGRMRLRAGRLKRAVPVGDRRRSADKAALCVIKRGDCLMLDPLPVDDAVRTLIREPEPGYDLFPTTRIAEAVRAIASGGCWQLTLSHDPHAAMALLIDAFERQRVG